MHAQEASPKWAHLIPAANGVGEIINNIKKNLNTICVAPLHNRKESIFNNKNNYTKFVIHFALYILYNANCIVYL